MRGKRGARGISHRNTATVAGENYTGNAAGVVAPWGSGSAGASTPAIGVGPTITIPRDDDDDGLDIVAAKQLSGGKRVAADSTKPRFRTQLKTLANWITWIMQVLAGTLSAKALAVDGVGGAAATPPNGTVSVTGSVAGYATPTPAFVRGVVYKESPVFAICTSDGAVFTGGVNIANFVNTGPGLYTITLGTHASSAARMAIVGLSNGGFVTGAAFDDHTIFIETLQISTSGPTITPVNNNFSIVIYHL